MLNLNKPWAAKFSSCSNMQKNTLVWHVEIFQKWVFIKNSYLSKIHIFQLSIYWFREWTMCFADYTPRLNNVDWNWFFLAVCAINQQICWMSRISEKSHSQVLWDHKQTKKGDIYQFRLLLSARWSPLAVNCTYCQALCQEMLGREVAVPPAEIMPHPQNPFLCQILLSIQENPNVTDKNSSVEKSFTRQDCAGVDKNNKTWLVSITKGKWSVCQRAPPSSWKFHVLTKIPLRHHFRREN